MSEDFPTPTTPVDKKWWVISGVGVGIGVALAIWFGISASTGKPLWTDTGYHVDSDRKVTVRYDLTRPVGREVVCTVRALDVHHATVGSVRVTVPKADAKTTHETATVRTTVRAVTGVVQTCAFPGDVSSS